MYSSFNSVGRNISALFWLYQKTKGTLRTSRTYKIIGSPLNSTRKKVTVEKNPKRHPENGIFHPMISWVYLLNIHYSLGIFMSKYLAKMYHGDYRMSKWSILMASSNFYTVNVIFGQTIPEKMYIFWEWDFVQKSLQWSLMVFYTKECFRLVSDFFVQLF